ncbi:MAG: glycosyltransferase [Azospirillaceae bacterium]|nr:glycosyltransferase [Azospirillaceae bacterium]
MRILFHVQHLLGVGHLKRAAMIARAAAAMGHDITVASGGPPLPGVDFGAARIIQLPPARTADASFRVLIDPTGHPVDDAWKIRRTAALEAAFAATAPELVLIESFPFGRRALRFELEPLVTWTRRAGAPLASSVRDILVAKSPDKRALMVETARRWFDAVLVHGDPALVTLGASFPEADQIANLIRYTGYVTAPPPAAVPDGDGAGEVVVSVGGGAVGLPLLEAAMAARPLCGPLAAVPWRLLCGPDLGATAVATLRDRAGPGIIIEPARPDFAALLARCRVSVSQAGYNTMMDLLHARCPAVVVPFAAGGETEQTQRAHLFQHRGLLQVVAEATLTPAALAAAIARAVAAPRPAPGEVQLDGAAETVRLLATLAAPR